MKAFVFSHHADTNEGALDTSALAAAEGVRIFCAFWRSGTDTMVDIQESPSELAAEAQLDSEEVPGRGVHEACLLC